MLAAAQPLVAQGGRGGGRAGAPPARDTTPSRQTPDGTVMDFSNQDIQQVLRAIAEAGNLNVTMASMPQLNVSLRVQMKMTQEEARDILKSVAEINGITVTDSPSIIRLVGPPPAPRTPVTPPLNAQQLLQQQQRVMVVNMIRLKHATASVLAPTLMSLFTGTGGGGAVNNNIGRGAGGLGNVGAAGNAAGGRGAAGRGGAAGGAGGAGGGRGGGGGAVALPGGGAINLGGGGGIQQQLAQAFGGVLGVVRPFSDMRIMAEPSTNSLMVLSTAEDFAVLQTLVGGIDLRPLQVLIEVTIAQVQRTHDLDVGISGSVRKNGATTSEVTKTTAGPTTSTTTTTTTKNKTDTSTMALLPSAAGAKDFIAQLMGGKGNINQAVALNALQTRGDVRVLSLPVIIAQNNVQAVISVGSQVPFVSVSQTVPNDPTGRVQTIQYQTVGTTLTIVPVINPDGYVNLTIDQTANDVTSNLLFDAPIINNREASTQVFVRDGQTTAIGGLADNASNNSTSGIPILSSIPFIGHWLFGNTTQHKDATELYLFLTPHIISSDEDIDRMRNAIRSTSEMLQSVPLHSLNPTGDTLFIGVKKDSTKKPPPKDSTAKPIKPPPPLPAPRDSSSFRNLPSLPREENPLD
jgi:general secretion pathway protein D